jgi:DNA segregation ATPase FtsK/SpoIIIE-like protein
MNEIKIVFDNELLECGLKFYHEVDFSKTPHMMVIGGTGSGKSYAVQQIIAKIALANYTAKATVLDFKGDDYKFAQNCERLYEFDKCLEGLEKFYKEFTDRQKGLDHNRAFRLLVIEELGSMISYFEKKQVDAIKSMVANLILMGRSFNIHVIISTQRPDTSYFNSGVRDSIGTVIALGNLSKEGKAMLFKGFEDKMNPVHQRGAGYMLRDGSDFVSIRVPNIKDVKNMRHYIRQILS